MFNETGRTETFTIPGGATFSIMADNNGLFLIVMKNGGVTPEICNQRFTSYKAAKKAIEDHVERKTKVTYPNERIPKPLAK